jgi:RimJ/RimL family protein N-acetyltransferase
MSLTFHYLQESDIPELEIMFTQYNPGDELMEYNPEQIKKFLTEKQNIAFVAKLNNKVVGCIYGYALMMIDEVEKEFFIYGFDIHPEHHSKGYGTEFMKCVLNWAKDNGFRESYVMTDSSNHAACRGYEKAGMEQDDWKTARSYVAKH